MSRKKILISVGSALLACLLMWYYVHGFNVSLAKLAASIVSIDLILLCAAVFSTLLNFILISIKWRYIATKIGIKKVSLGFYIFNVSLGAVLGIILPQQISFFCVRTLSLRFAKGQSFGKSGFSVLYDLFFTFYPVLLMFIAVLVIAPKITGKMDLLAGVVIFGTGYLLIHFFMTARFIQAALNFYQSLRNSVRFLPKIKPQTTVISPQLFSFDSTRFLFSSSLIQNLNLVLRNYIIVRAAGLKIGILTIFFAYPLIYFSVIAGITPGNFGVTEWVWTGTLAFLDVKTEVAVQYALLNRVVILFSQISVFSFVVFVFFGIRIWKRVEKKSPVT